MWDSRIDDISLFAVRDIKGSEVISVCKKMSRSSLTRRACVVWRLRRLAGAWLSIFRLRSGPLGSLSGSAMEHNMDGSVVT